MASAALMKNNPSDRDSLTTPECSRYSSGVEAFAPTGPKRKHPSKGGAATGHLARVTKIVEPHLKQVDARITAQAAAFDPAIEAYVSYAIGGRGKRLRPLVALLSAGATGHIESGHVDLAV